MARRRDLRTQILRYLGISAVLHPAWETAQVPLYTIWHDGTAGQIAFAVIHCAAGDMLITAAMLALAIGLASLARWRLFGPRMALTAIICGLAYTVYSEWFNVVVRRSWAYTETMPVLPPLGTGLSPLLQWIIVPIISWRFARARRP